MSHDAPAPIGLRWWQRFHVRLTALYGAALLAVLTPAAVIVYDVAVDAELDNLWTRLRMSAVALAGMVDGDRLVAVKDADDPYRVELFERFRDVMSEQPELCSVYIFVRTDRPDRLRFVVDTDLRAEPAHYGELYDATIYSILERAWESPQVEREPVHDAWGVSVTGAAPIHDRAGRAVALIGVDVDAARVDRLKARLLRVAAATYLAALALLALAALGVARLVRRPVGRIVQATEAVARGDLSARTALERGDELGLIGRHFDRMASGLEERDFIRATFGRYVSEDVARKLLADRRDAILQGEDRRVTVLFSDLRGYTRLSEGLPPADVLGLMNQYLEAMNGAIDAHDGCVIEYLGDGILTVFGAPDDLQDHPERAVRCALAMREELNALNARWERDGTASAWQALGLARLSARIGIHTGHVVAGSLGSQVRLKYTILGDTVNIAARLETMNNALSTDILISDDVYRDLPAELKATAHPHGEQPVKGREQPVVVYSV
ncbi:MAG: adenylate/guanylate cyclase domain-containing protein [Deltaproteobacteria bacterium]|nr:MAG: adenylate/guanylate cyclase domain-containing protein [Deltaproteobacteria bacterium]